MSTKFIYYTNLAVDWEALFSDNNINEKWAIFKEVLDNAVSKFVPNTKRRTRQKQLCWTRCIEQARNMKKKCGIFIRM